MARRVQLVLEFEDAEPISGSLRGDDGGSRRFSGWLGLMAAIKETAGNEPSPLATDERPSVSDGDLAP
jgi:hypothetical protein